MPNVTNPSASDLFCEPLGRVLLAGETVEATDNQVALISRAVFVVSDADVEEDEKPARRRAGVPQTGKGEAVEER